MGFWPYCEWALQSLLSEWILFKWSRCFDTWNFSQGKVFEVRFWPKKAIFKERLEKAILPQRP
jgi:hypothetical protein